VNGRPPQAEPTGPTVASIAPPTGPRDEFDIANASLKDGHYEAAETGFRTFLQKFPKDRLAADATFYLGESFYRRSRPREAAEQYFKVSTDFSKSPRAPEALLKLGMSLEKLGAREQACAAFGEVGRKYPNASTALRTSAERESKRAQC
jgi:tol-pal system protein YbgF